MFFALLTLAKEDMLFHCVEGVNGRGDHKMQCGGQEARQGEAGRKKQAVWGVAGGLEREVELSEQSMELWVLCGEFVVWFGFFLLLAHIGVAVWLCLHRARST